VSFNERTVDTRYISGHKIVDDDLFVAAGKSDALMIHLGQ
jgi:hypothetical protein